MIIYLLTNNFDYEGSTVLSAHTVLQAAQDAGMAYLLENSQRTYDRHTEPPVWDQPNGPDWELLDPEWHSHFLMIEALVVNDD